MSQLVRALALRAWFPLVLVALWEASSRLSGNVFFPSPSTIGQTLWGLDLGVLWERALAPTLQLLAVGYAIGAVGGIFIGVLLGSSNTARRVTYPLAVFVKALPTAAKLPVILAVLGLGAHSLVLAVSISVFFNVLITTTLGVARVHWRTLETAQLMELGWMRTAFGVRLPAATGDILTGLQLALQVAILVTVLVETLASDRGLGAFLQDAQYSFRLPEMWVAIMLLGLVGVVLNEAFNSIERVVSPWYFETRTAS